MRHFVAASLLIWMPLFCCAIEFHRTKSDRNISKVNETARKKVCHLIALQNDKQWRLEKCVDLPAVISVALYSPMPLKLSFVRNRSPMTGIYSTKYSILYQCRVQRPNNRRWVSIQSEFYYTEENRKLYWLCYNVHNTYAQEKLVFHVWPYVWLPIKKWSNSVRDAAMHCLWPNWHAYFRTLFRFSMSKLVSLAFP